MHLSASQRAVLLLRDVLGFAASEVADLLDTTVAGVSSALQRTRKVIAGLHPEPSQQRTLHMMGDAAQREVAQRYLAAWEAGDVDAIVAMLTDDARYSMPPLATWYQGQEAIRGFVADAVSRYRWRFVPAWANGQVSFGTYLWSDERAAFVPAGLDLLRLRGEQVAEVVSFLDADFAAFGLPVQLTAR